MIEVVMVSFVVTIVTIAAIVVLGYLLAKRRLAGTLIGEMLP